MATGKIHFKSDAGGITSVSREAGVTNGELVLPASGTVASVSGVVTDNAIARYDSTTGKLQNSGVVIDDNDNVGIGVTPSAWSNFPAIQLAQGISISQGGLGQNTYYNAGFKYIATSGATLYQPTGSTHTWYTAPSGTAGRAIAFTAAMTLDANGKLIFGANTFSGRMSFTGDWAAYGDTHITFKNNPTTNFGNIIFINAAGTQVGYIQASSTATSYSTSSDYRLKEDWKPMQDSITRLMELKPCNFKWKETENRVDGFLAHELQEVVPEVVFGTKDGMKEEEYEICPKVEATYDEDGNELTPAVDAVIGKREVPDYQGIDQSKLVPLLTASLQDAVKIINNLKSRIEILEGAK